LPKNQETRAKPNPRGDRPQNTKHASNLNLRKKAEGFPINN